MKKTQIIQNLVDTRKSLGTKKVDGKDVDVVSTRDIARNISITKHDELFIDQLETSVKVFETQKRDNNKCRMKDYVPAWHMAIKQQKALDATERQLLVRALTYKPAGKIVEMNANVGDIRG